MTDEEDFEAVTERERFEEWWKTQDLSNIPLELQSLWANGCFMAWHACSEIAEKNETAIINMYQIKIGKLTSRIGELETLFKEATIYMKYWRDFCPDYLNGENVENIMSKIEKAQEDRDD